jgi:hypothetical protein
MLPKCKIYSIDINGTSVSSVPCVKYLGAFLDSELSLKKQVTEKCRTAINALRLVRNIRHVLTMEACHTFVLGLVISHLDFSNSLYINLPDVEIKNFKECRI